VNLSRADQIPDPPSGASSVIRPVRVLVIGMPQIYREALSKLINEANGFKVLADARTGRESLELCRRHGPDILLITADLEDGDGIEVSRQILRAKPATKIILLQSTRDEDAILRAIRSGAHGFLLTSEPACHLMEALRAVAQGRAYVAASAWDIVLNRLQKIPTENRPRGLQTLSPRHRQILNLIVEGKTSKQIAAILGVAVSFIRVERKTLLRRMDVKTTSELILAALAQGFKAGPP
jgi:DNA-binding NarL/FixJ family response regulator